MVRTPWGYEVDVEPMPPLIDAAQYARLAGVELTEESTPRIQATLEAVSAAIRAYCGWHIAPVLACQARCTGNGRMLELPTLTLVSVDAIEVDGGPVDMADVRWRECGLVRLRRGHWPADWGSVVVDFTSGYDLDQVPDIGAVVAQIASNAMAGAPGVASERAGEVSITYNATGYGVAGGVTLLDRDRALLEPHRLPTMPR